MNDEFERQNALNLTAIDLCAPENGYDYNMPNPYLPDNMDDIMSGLTDIIQEIEAFDNSGQYNGNNTDTIQKDYDDYINQLIDDIGSGEDNSQNNSTSNEDESDTKDDTLTNDVYTIVEFGDEYTLGDKLEYTLHVKPGQEIDNHTIIATIKQNGEEKQVRSIFSKGKVLQDKGGDFLHLYPGYADRHIIISDTEVGTGIDYDIEDMKGFIGKMQANGMLFSFIKDNLCYSILPNILQRHEAKALHYIIDPASGNRVPHDTLGLCPCKTSHDIYNAYVKKYEDKLNKWLKSFKSLCSKQRIYATRTSPSKMKSLYKEIVKKREALLRWIISYYQTKDDLGTCRYSPNMNDCRYLGWGKIINTKKLHGSDVFSTKVGSVWYNSYYGILISKLILGSNDSWNQKYYELLKGIIDNRIRLERYTQTSLINEFDTLYKHNIQNVVGNHSPFDFIRKEFMSNADISEDDKELYVKVYQYLIDKHPKKNTYVCQQLANIFWFIIHYTDNIDKASDTVENKELDDKAITELVREEKAKLEAFWERVIQEYYSNTMEALVSGLEQYADSMNNYAEWPACMQIPIEGTMYDLYEFNNFPVTEYQEIEEDVQDIETVEKPSEEPFIPPGPYLDNSAAIPEDVSKEITLKDTAYWRRYFTLATIISIGSLADGFDIPPHMSPTLLPAIYICFKAIYIPLLNMVLVIGLGIRGIWIFPILLVVNLNSAPANGLLPLIIIAKNIQNMFSRKLMKIDQMVPNLAKIMISKLRADNEEYNRDKQKYMLYLDVLRSQNIENVHVLEQELSG